MNFFNRNFIASVYVVQICILYLSTFQLTAAIFPCTNDFVNLVCKQAPQWMDAQIEQDFSYFREGISQENIDDTYTKVARQLGQSNTLRITVKNKQLMTQGTLNDRAEAILSAVKYLIQNVGLPDVDCIASLHDGCHYKNTLTAPVLAFAKHVDANNCVLIPDFEGLQGYEERESLHKDFLQSYPWDQKTKKVFWRGVTTGGMNELDTWFKLPRALLVLESFNHPNVIDAKFTQVCQCSPSAFQSELEEILESKNLLGANEPISKHLEYRYLVDIDGNSCTYSRCYWILLSNSMLFKPDSKNIQWYYGGLIPYVNYLPLKADLSDIVEKIEWAKERDAEAKTIAEQGAVFAENNLSLEYIYLYLYKVLVKHATLQVKK